MGLVPGFLILGLAGGSLAAPAGAFTRNGDLNLDGALDLSDAISLLGYLFLGDPPPVEIRCAPCDSCCPEVAKLLATGVTRCVDIHTGEFLEDCPKEGEPGYGQDGVYQAGASRKGQYEVVTFGDPDKKKWLTVDYATGLLWQYYPFYGAPGYLSHCEALEQAGFDDWRLPNLFELLSLWLLPSRWWYRGTTPIASAAMDISAFDRAYPGSLTSTGDLYTGSPYGVDFGYPWFGQGFGGGQPCTRCVRSLGPDDLKALGLPEPWERVRTPGRNGDLDGDGKVDLNDVVLLLKHLYLGGGEPVEVSCPGCDTCCPDFPARPVFTGADKCWMGGFEGWVCGDRTAPNFGQDGDYQLGLRREFLVEDLGSTDTRDWVTVDPVLGLMWQYRVARSSMSWAGALAYCEKLTLAGFDDWRLPNLFEFVSLMDFGRTPPVYDEYFSWPDPPGSHWTSTPVREPYMWDGQKIIVMYMVQDSIQSWSWPMGNPPVLLYVRAVRTLRPGDLEKIGHR